MRGWGWRTTVWQLFILLIASAPIAVSAHRSGCHRWHSCPSDTGSYVCGDLGYCSQCPDNQYCQAGQPRPTVQPAPAPSPPAGAQDETYLVTLVIDGDTFELESGERVRLIGVDTPEMDDPRPTVRALAEEATAFTRRMVEGKRVRLEYDQEPYDRYGRILAYVYLEDETFLNVEIIRQGFGYAETRFPFKRLEEFRKLEQEAREAGHGMWGGR